MPVNLRPPGFRFSTTTAVAADTVIPPMTNWGSGRLWGPNTFHARTTTLQCYVARPHRYPHVVSNPDTPISSPVSHALAGAIIPAVAALVGAAIGGGFTAQAASVAAETQQAMQQAQFDQEQSRLLREKREPYYATYDAAVQKFATQVSSRYECELQKVACRYSRNEVQTARYDLQGAINDIHIFGSAEMRDAVGIVAGTMPSTMVGLTGAVQVGPVDAKAFRSATNRTRAITCFDISPDYASCPPPS